MDQPVKPEPKKPYIPPKLIVYGTVRELTLHQGRHGGADSPPTRPLHTKTGLP